jgi:hypothetical protein
MSEVPLYLDSAGVVGRVGEKSHGDPSRLLAGPLLRPSIVIDGCLCGRLSLSTAVFCVYRPSIITDGLLLCLSAIYHCWQPSMWPPICEGYLDSAGIVGSVGETAPPPRTALGP